MIPDCFNEAEGLFGADVMHQPLQACRPDWNDRFCTDPAAALNSRRWALDHAAERRALVFTGHFARSSAGHVTRRGDGFEWQFAQRLSAKGLFH